FYIEAYAYQSPLVFRWYVDGVWQEQEDEFIFEHVFTTGGSHQISCIVSSDDYSRELSWHLVSSTAIPEIAISSTSLRIDAIYPNPANKKVYVSFETDATAKVEVAVYNLKGQKVASISDGFKSKGKHQELWQLRDYNGKELPAGMYILRLTSGNQTAQRKLIIW
ncbi:MAG: T9SS type A sorting domain-containing protein, partial [Candidatus Cloacimonadaceae bacterium]|nr:T9SS type A sorting domain-containing protein [Candidatus Cloacimonadaceae bacterium]